MDEPQLSQQEYLELESLLKTGDPYLLFGLNYQDGKIEIEKRYNEIMLNGIGIMNETQIEAIENAYKLLTNDSYRRVYDKYIIQFELNEKKMAENFEKAYSGLITVALRLLLVPSQMISTITNSPLSKSSSLLASTINTNSIHGRIENTKEIIKSIYKAGGIKGFYRGFIFSVSTFPIEFIRVLNLEILKKLSTSVGGGKGVPNKFFELLDDLTYLLTSYPAKLTLDCLVLSPLSMSTFQVIKNVVLGQQNNPTLPFSFKNLYYGAVCSIPLYLLSRSARMLVNYGVDKIKKITEATDDELESTNTISPLVKYSSLFLTNIVTTSVVKSVLCSPFYVLIAHYPSQMVASYLTSSPLPPAINPINLAINLYKSNGISYFYKGLLPLTVVRLLDSLIRIYSLEPVDHEITLE